MEGGAPPYVIPPDNVDSVKFVRGKSTAGRDRCWRVDRSGVRTRPVVGSVTGSNRRGVFARPCCCRPGAVFDN
jgi:hypothetical protein